MADTVKSWKCRLGLHIYGEPQLVSVLVMREQCARCGLARYFNGALGENFYRQEMDYDD